MKQEHALVAIMQGKFPTTKFNVSESGDVLNILWIDGPRASQVAEHLEATDLPKEYDDMSINAKRGYSPSAINSAIQKLASLTPTPIGKPVIRDTAMKHGFIVDSDLMIDLDGEQVSLKAAVGGILASEDLSVVANVSPITVERIYNGKVLKISMARGNGKTVDISFGPQKAEMIVAALPDIQAFISEVSE